MSDRNFNFGVEHSESFMNPNQVFELKEDERTKFFQELERQNNEIQVIRENNRLRKEKFLYELIQKYQSQLAQKPMEHLTERLTEKNFQNLYLFLLGNFLRI